MFAIFGRWAVNHPGKVCAVWAALAFLLTLFAPDWKKHAQDDDIRFLPARFASVQAYQILEQAFPRDVSACKVIFAVERGDRPLDADDMALVDRMVADLNALRIHEPELDINGVTSHRDPLIGSRLVSVDRQCTLIPVALGTPYLAEQTRRTVERTEATLRQRLAEVGESAPRLYVTGQAGIGRDLVKATVESIDHTTLATVLLVVIVLLLIYRSPLLALIPLVTIGIAVWVTMQLLALVTLIPGVHLVNVSQVFAVVILFGAGTDYCLFLVSRYREGLEVGEESRSALHRSVRSVGGALAASAATVVVGLGMMGFAEFGKIRCAGPIIALGLIVAVAASLTLTPALLQLLGLRAFWPHRLARRGITILTEPRRPTLWERISRLVVRYPVWVWSLSLLVLIPLAVLGLRVGSTFNPIGELSPNADSVRGMNVIQRHFTAGETGPITVLLSARTNWDTPAGRELIHRLSRGFAHLDNVAEVRSLTQPFGQPPSAEKRPILEKNPSMWMRSLAGELGGAFRQAAHKAAVHYYIAEIPSEQGPLAVTRLDVVLKSDPFADASVTTLEVIEDWLAHSLPSETLAEGSVAAHCHGVTVHTRDMARLVASDRARVNTLVLLGVFLILLVLVRRLWLAGYLLGTVLLSYYATLGLTALFASWLTGRPFGQIEWRVPFFLFTILVAVGEDYNILLVTRVLQERKRHGPIEGLRRGLAATGGTITACGLIMAGTFGTLMLAELGTLIQIGFALAIGVLLDTFLVRPFLVPSFILLVWAESEPPRQQRVGTLPLRSSSRGEAA